MRKQNAAGGIQARRFITTSAQRACAALFALVLLSPGAAKADLVVPLATFQADVFSGAEAKVVCGAPGPNCGGPLGTNETTTPQVAQLDTLSASTNPGPQIESLTTIASGTSTPAVLSGGNSRAETRFYIAVEQTNPSVPAMAVPVVISIGMSASAEIGTIGNPNAQIVAGATLLVNEGSLIPAPHVLGLTQTYSVGDTCSVAGCDGSVCELGFCTLSDPSTTVNLQEGFVPGDRFLLLTMIAQGSAGLADGDFNAVIDPHIVIDPSFPFADDFAIVLSPNIITAASAVPEPAPALLIAPAALGLGLLALRKRRPSGRACRTALIPAFTG